MPDLHFLRELLVSCVSYLQLLLEVISVICIVLGLAKTMIVILKTKQGRAARYCLGNWLATALEFQLAADILVTTVDPDLDSLVKLGIIAVIRTFLNYFLSKELEHSPEEKKAA